ncbi:MAG: WXG100 family type VII secretion target [Anaerolineales bacterium]|nr:WXG100 family type VII secretion target [Anaerolineales bacterium]
MSAPQVRAQHDELKNLQNTFRAQSEAIGQMNQNLKARFDTLQGGDWIGVGANAYFNEMNGAVFPALNRLRNALAEAARLTSQISDLMRQAEDDASRCMHV